MSRLTFQIVYAYVYMIHDIKENETTEYCFIKCGGAGYVLLHYLGNSPYYYLQLSKQVSFNLIWKFEKWKQWKYFSK